MNKNLINELNKTHYELEKRAYRNDDDDLYRYSVITKKAIKALEKERVLKSLLDLTWIALFWAGFFLLAHFVYK